MTNSLKVSTKISQIIDAKGDFSKWLIYTGYNNSFQTAKQTRHRRLPGH